MKSVRIYTYLAVFAMALGGCSGTNSTIGAPAPDDTISQVSEAERELVAAGEDELISGGAEVKRRTDAIGAGVSSASQALTSAALGVSGDPEKLKAAVLKRYINDTDYDSDKSATLTYSYGFADLNGDAYTDALVLPAGPHYCGSGGCTFMVLRGQPDGTFAFVSSTPGVRAPIRAGTRQAAGWRPLIVNTRGTGDVVLDFAGGKYTGFASSARAATRAEVGQSVRVNLRQAEAKCADRKTCV